LRDTRPTQSELASVASLLTTGTSPKNAPSERFNEYSEDQLLGLLDYHGVTMLAGHFGTLPKNLKPVIAQRKAMMAANDSLKKIELIRLFDAFANAGLNECVLFKGSALAYTLYSSPWLRPRSDSDILVNPSYKGSFEKIFVALGYKKQFAIEGNYVSYQSTYSKELVGRSAINIDLHWRINNRQILASSFSAQELYRYGKPLTKLSSNITIPCTTHCLLISSLHRLGHHQNEERLTWLYDIHLLANSFVDSDWKHLVEQAKDKQLCAITLDALQHCECLLNTKIPDYVLTKLLKGAQHSEPSKLFLQRDVPERTLFWNDLKAMPSLSAKVSLLLETFIPSPGYIRQQMNTKYALWGYLKRVIRGIKRVF
jgi:hypothetical protein